MAGTATLTPDAAHPSRRPRSSQQDSQRDAQRGAQRFDQPQRHGLTGFAARLGPNWYAAVMGTAIIGNAARTLPWLGDHGRLDGLAAAFWTLSAAMLLALGGLRLLARRDPGRVRALDTPASAVFFGCPPMAMLAVGFGAQSAGLPVLGRSAAIGTDAVLWTAGTLYGVVVTARIAFRLALHHDTARAEASPTWFLPTVAPMVSAALGPALIPHLPQGQARLTLLLGCLGLFGASLLMVLVLLPVVWGRLLHEERMPLTLLPSMFLVLGPLGQSVTAAGQFSTQAAAATAGTPLAADGAPAALHAFALLYGVPVTGFALLWLAIATVATVHGVRRKMPFAMTWWAYTFPLGTCVTGTAALYRQTHTPLFAALSVTLFAALLVAWCTVTYRTTHSLTTHTLP